ncbi:4Fe-4S dicluster domain-containing protein [Solidesulfovibrio sp. C21]|uniref:4Fe-4S dicluster domain-containing protein n=1 Tax=Solidesulfovibrio sp. C21 TaxID=3398613 RepID=UPI0039FBCBE3
MKRRRLQPEARKVELLEAALSVLRSLGPIKARVEDVTTAAGTAKGTFYIYFSSWNNMLHEVRAHLLSKYISEIKIRFPIEAKKDWTAALKKECINFVDYREQLGELHNVIFHGPKSEIPHDNYLSGKEIFSWMLHFGIETGVCRDIDSELGGKFLFSILHTTADYIVSTGERERYLNMLFDLIEHWLGNPAFTATAPNIASQKKTNSMTQQTRSHWKPIVDFARCKGCGKCIALCSNNVFELHSISSADYKQLNWFRRMRLRHNGLRVAYAIRTKDCRNCGQCLNVCREHAIQQKSEPERNGDAR